MQCYYIFLGFQKSATYDKFARIYITFYVYLDLKRSWYVSDLALIHPYLYLKNYICHQYKAKRIHLWCLLLGRAICVGYTCEHNQTHFLWWMCDGIVYEIKTDKNIFWCIWFIFEFFFGIPHSVLKGIHQDLLIIYELFWE